MYKKNKKKNSQTPPVLFIHGLELWSWSPWLDAACEFME